MPSIKERIEQNLTIWLLSTLLAGFLAGIGAFKTILEIGDLTPVAKTVVVEHQKTVDDLKAKSDKQQETIDRLDKTIAASLAREDSLKQVYAAEIATTKKLVSLSASKLSSAFKSIRNSRVCIKHLPSQAASANRLVALLDRYGAITEVSPTTYDRSYWSVVYRLYSDKALTAATQIKTLVPELNSLPLRQTPKEDGVYDIIIWLDSDHR